MAFDFTPTQQQVLDFGDRLAQQFDRSSWIERTAAREFPVEIWAGLGATGHLGILVPEHSGGAGLGLTEMALLAEGLAASGFPLLTLGTGPGLALPALARHGNDRQRSDILPDLMAGRTVLPFALTEAAVGSNIMRPAARAEPNGDDYILSGEKNFTSAANVAKHIMVPARTPELGTTGRDRDGFALFLVPTDAKGPISGPTSPGFHCRNGSAHSASTG